MKTFRSLLHYIYLAGLLMLVGMVAGCTQLVPQLVRPSTQTQLVPPTGGTPAAKGNITPAVTVADQNYDGTTVAVADVVSAGPGWMVIHNQQNGAIGAPIGFAELKPGDNPNIQVRIDPKQATPVMYAMLHLDAGTVGKYEFPGPDAPVFLNGQMLSPAFRVTKQSGQGSGQQVTPLVQLQNQQVSSGQVTVQEVDSNGPGWLAIHVQNPDGTPGSEIGFSAVKPGKNPNVVVIIDPTKITRVLIAMLHQDAGDVGMYEFPGPDTPVMANGTMVAQAFSSDGSALGAQPTLMASMKGMEQTTPAATPGAQANAPTTATMAPMPTAANTATMAPSATSTNSNGGMSMDTPAPGVNPLVKVSDQPLTNGALMVDDVVSSGPGWVVIYTLSASGQPDQPIGHAAVKNGDNRNVMVQVDPAKAKGTLIAQLHTDAGKVGTFEFPGPDMPVMINVTMISGQFKITTPQAAGSSNTQNPQAAPTALVPSITMADQPVKHSSVVVPKVVTDKPSWVVIHRMNGDGSVGPGIGDAVIPAGVSTNVVVDLQPGATSSTMVAMLHYDLGKKGVLEFPGPDVPVMVNNQMVAPTFKVTYSSDSDVILNVANDVNNTSYLVDGRGMTLYISLNDHHGSSSCTGDCLKTFQPVYATGQIVIGPGINAKKVSVITRDDGSRQVTYAGAPLYYDVYDLNPNDMKGQGLNGAWFTAMP